MIQCKGTQIKPLVLLFDLAAHVCPVVRIQYPPAAQPVTLQPLLQQEVLDLLLGRFDLIGRSALYGFWWIRNILGSRFRPLQTVPKRPIPN